MYRTLAVEPVQGGIQVGLDSPRTQNSLSRTMVGELHLALTEAENTPDCRLLVIRGSADYFCSGLDLAEAAGQDACQAGRGDPFFSLLRRFTSTPLLVVSKVSGRVSGGGVGLAAASDVVVATSSAVFGLPEALWGLLPCCVLPFLIRRVGFQKAYAMTLTTRPVTAAEALSCHLVDEVSDEPDASIRRLGFRVRKVSPTTMTDAKRYFAALHQIPPETESLAVTELSRLLGTPDVRDRLKAFAEQGLMPWSRAR